MLFTNITCHPIIKNITSPFQVPLLSIFSLVSATLTPRAPNFQYFERFDNHESFKYQNTYCTK